MVDTSESETESEPPPPPKKRKLKIVLKRKKTFNGSNQDSLCERWIRDGFKDGWTVPLESIRGKFNMGLARAKRIRDRVVEQWKSEGKRVPTIELKKRRTKRKGDPLSSPTKRVKRREVISEETALQLRKAYSFNSNPKKHEIEVLAEMVGLRPNSVEDWFRERKENRRKNINVAFVLHGQAVFATSIPNFPRKHKKLKRTRKKSTEYSDDEADWEMLGRTNAPLTSRQRSYLDRKTNPHYAPLYKTKKRQLTEEESLKKAELSRKRAIAGAEKLQRLKQETVRRLLESEDTARTRKEEKNQLKMQKLKRQRQSNPYSTIRWVSRSCEKQGPDGKIQTMIENKLAMPLGYRLQKSGDKLIMAFTGYNRS